jgi:hypothetical protein
MGEGGGRGWEGGRVARGGAPRKKKREASWGKAAATLPLFLYVAWGARTRIASALPRPLAFKKSSVSKRKKQVQEKGRRRVAAGVRARLEAKGVGAGGGRGSKK